MSTAAAVSRECTWATQFIRVVTRHGFKRVKAETFGQLAFCSSKPENPFFPHEKYVIVHVPTGHNLTAIPAAHSVGDVRELVEALECYSWHTYYSIHQRAQKIMDAFKERCKQETLKR